MRKLIYCLLVLSAACFDQTSAQTALIPEPSTLQTVQQNFGLGTISIVYSRPNMKGRKIFGITEPYGIVWRTGANFATVLTLSDTVTIADHVVAPGNYSLFSIPDKSDWTVILNKTAKQWGAYSYDSTQDLIRFKIKPVRTDKLVETFTIQFMNVSPEYAELHLVWENTDLSIPFRTDVDARVMANIDSAMNTAKKPWYRAAIYYYNHDKDIKKALDWITEADKASPNAYNMKYWKARMQLKAGDKAGAIATANEGLKLAEAEPNAEYIRLNKEVLTAAGK